MIVLCYQLKQSIMTIIQAFQQELENEAVVTRKMLALGAQRQVPVETPFKKYDPAAIGNTYCRTAYLDWYGIEFR